MNRNGFQKLMYSVTLIYIGMILLIAPYIFHSPLIEELSDGVGMLCVFMGAFLLFYNRLSRKIDNISNNIFNMNKAGIEQIIPADSNGFNDLEKILYGSRNVEIAINVYRLTDKLCYFFNSLFENNLVRYKIIFVGPLDDPKVKFFIESLQKKERENIFIRTLKDPPIDNLIVFDKKSCIMHYNDHDNKLSFSVLFYAGSEDSLKNKQLFDALWAKGKSFSNSGEGESCP